MENQALDVIRRSIRHLFEAAHASSTDYQGMLAACQSDQPCLLADHLENLLGEEPASLPKLIRGLLLEAARTLRDGEVGGASVIFQAATNFRPFLS